MKVIFRYIQLKPISSLIISALVVFAIGCTNPNSDAPSSGTVHTKAWNNPKFLNSNEFHGTQANRDGSNACRLCHGKNLTGSDDILGCFDCHFGPNGSQSPHESGWVHGQSQHELYATHQNVCNACHEIRRKYNLGPQECHDCHGPGANHALGQAWLDKNSPQFHGNETTNSCSDCHEISTFCATCHFDETGSKAPLGSAWEHGDNPDHRNFEDAQLTCNQCHNLNRSYGNEPSVCHDCHGEGINHVLGQDWLDKNSAQFHGNEPTDNCADCHDLNLTCNECHFGVGGSRAPLGSGWIHGFNDDHEHFESYQSVCNRCHDLNRSYLNEPTGCHDCHDD